MRNRTRARNRPARGRRVYLHIGAPKTGTTYLQAMLAAHRDRLREDGCLYPVGKGSAHHREARDLRDARPGGYLHPSTPGAWERLVRRVDHWTGDGAAVISSELLVYASRDEAARAVGSLAPAEVHLVLTVRDLARQIPAVWQERVKNGSVMTYEEFLEQAVADEDGRGPHGLWNGQDPTRILDRWAPGLPPEHVHLVTVPPPGSDPRLLWQRFAGLLGLDADAYPSVPGGSNASLGVAETEVVRRLNTRVGEAPWPFYSRHVKAGIAQGALAERTRSSRITLPEHVLPVVERRTKRILDTLQAGGFDVVGDLGELMPATGVVGDVPEPDAQSMAEAWAAAAEYLATSFARTWKRRDARRRARG